VSPAAHARGLALILIAQAGWRPESRSLLWASLFAGSVALGLVITELGNEPLTLVYFGVAYVVYYGWHTLRLHRRAREGPLAKPAEARAWERYQVMVGMSFLHIGLAFGALCALADPRWPLPLDAGIRVGLGLTLVVIGLGIKVWATAAVGIDTYYFKDLFTGRRSGPLVLRGPYRWSSNPMYGLGYLHAYGLAVLADSWLGLAAAALCQLGIYVFLIVVERPFLRRAYGPAVAVGTRIALEESR